MIDTIKTSTFLSHDPHGFLGRHHLDDLFDIIVAYRPGFTECYMHLDGAFVMMDQGECEGIFYSKIPKNSQEIKMYHKGGLLAHDPYSFMPLFGEIDQYLFSKGVHYKLHERMGAHIREVGGIKGVHFSLWAPSAVKVCVMGDFNHFCQTTNPMRSLGSSGVWELFVPGLDAGEKYKFCITTAYGSQFIKTDPYGRSFELRPKNAAIVTESCFKFTDHEYLNARSHKDFTSEPMSIYELHLGSWKKGMGYREAALEIASYLVEMGYTHLELLPVLEHPLDESWGYQVTGFFAPTSRFGTLDDFKFFINHMHSCGIGVILDWVPAHFPSDSHALAQFDGSALYEHQDPKKGFHPHWNTLIFNYGRHEVQNFLISSALFWLEECHLDGLRVDAVASMLYLDYGKTDGEWIPNIYGGKENLEAIEFLKHLNSIVHHRVKGALMIAEESTSFYGVTRPLEEGGLGFDFKWNMGWMNDTLRYFSTDPFYRKYHQNLLTFGMIYVYSEKFLNVLSHDEVVHGKRSLLSKMPGDLWQKFANLRLLLSYTMTQPGKKLLFMGSELGDYQEWNIERSLSWHLLTYEESRGVKSLVKDLNHLYKDEKALHEKDHSHEGFEWISLDDHTNSVIAFMRKSSCKNMLIVIHATPQLIKNYDLYLPFGRGLKLRFNSDAAIYGGSNTPIDYVCNKCGASDRMKASITLPPLGCLIFDIL